MKLRGNYGGLFELRFIQLKLLEKGRKWVRICFRFIFWVNGGGWGGRRSGRISGGNSSPSASADGGQIPRSGICAPPPALRQQQKKEQLNRIWRHTSLREQTQSYIAPTEGKITRPPKIVHNKRTTHKINLMNKTQELHQPLRDRQYYDRIFSPRKIEVKAEQTQQKNRHRFNDKAYRINLMNKTFNSAPTAS